MSTRNARLLALAGALIAVSAGATTYQDNFTGGKAAMQWIALGDACLTAGTQNGTSSTSNPIIPGCKFKKDTTGKALATDSNQGALLLTPAVNSQTGAILSDFTFPMSQGLQVTFTTYSYGSTSNGAPANIGADGIVFFLTDGTQPVPADTGATGGALGYDCSVTNYGGVKKYEGIANGYLGLGMDEWGNFLNNGDNGSQGVLNTNAPGAPAGHGGNGWSNNLSSSPGDSSGWNYQPNRIGMRGAGNITNATLNALNPAHYPLTGDQHALVVPVCKSGKYVAPDGTKKTIATYDPIPGAYKALPQTQPLAHPNAKTLANATPITYKVTISPSGVLAFAYSYNNGDFQMVLDQTDISSINGKPPSSFRFGFSAGTGGPNNVHEITCFTASPLQANSSAGSNAVTGKAVQGATQFFLPGYSQDGWWGSLAAEPLVIDDKTGVLSIGTVANWDAKCALTGGPCDSMGVDTSGNPIHSVTGQTPDSRNLYTWTNKGVALQWANLSTAQHAALNVPTSNALDTTPGQNRLAWLRGDRTDEKLAKGCSSTPTATPPCDLRARTYVLGDIINSSPTFVASPVLGVLPDVFQDKINGADPNYENASGAQKYSAFAAANATRRHMVYVGSNDGFVHGFEAGAYNSDGSYNATYNDGNELLAYMPYDVLLNKAVNLANPVGTHDYLVDATPSYSDLYYGGTWHTWLVGGVGTNGQEIYALEVTDPTGFTASDVIGDWDNSSPGLSHLGFTAGTPIIARMHNGQWALIFGSGLHEDNDGNATANANTTAGIYIGLIDQTTGKIASFQFLDTGTGTAKNPDGIAYVSQLDLDGDHVADYLYAGDTQGNVWRFDVTSGNASTWGKSASRSLVFTAKDAAGNPQPITTAITLLRVQTGMVTRNMLYFGTGRETQQTNTRGMLYATGQQTFYGIWDWNMSSWNAMSSTKLASLTSGSVPTRNSLLVQVVQTNPDPSDLTHRYLDTTKSVCWQGDAPVLPQCPSPSQYGWMFDLPGQGPTSGTYANQNEQIIYNAAFVGGAIVVNTAIPPTISAAQCKAGQQSGWIMAFNPATGGGFPEGFFPDQGGGFSGGAVTVGGIQPNNGQGGTGTPTAIEYAGAMYLATQTLPPGGYITKLKDYSGANPARVSWRELVNP